MRSVSRAMSMLANSCSRTDREMSAMPAPASDAAACDDRGHFDRAPAAPPHTDAPRGSAPSKRLRTGWDGMLNGTPDGTPSVATFSERNIFQQFQHAEQTRANRSGNPPRANAPPARSGRQIGKRIIRRAVTHLLTAHSSETLGRLDRSGPVPGSIRLDYNGGVGTGRSRRPIPHAVPPPECGSRRAPLGGRIARTTG